MRSRLSYLKRIISAYVLNYKISNLSFWHTPLSANELKDEDLKSLRAYPQNFEAKIERVRNIDSCGVIMLDYKGDTGLQYNPNAIAQLALGFYDRILAGEGREKEFLTQAAYFLKHNRVVEDGVLLWEYNFPFEMRSYLHSPWRSALAQGQGISVCLRAHKLTKDDQYLEAAKKAFKSFHYLAGKHPGGVLDDLNGYTWLEEYIIEPPNHVLNGFVWALWGVRDFAVYTNDAYAWDLWNKCVKTLKDHLAYYDLGFWTTYDIVKFNPGKHLIMPVSTYYQNLHVVQMRAMYNLTSDPVFKHFEIKWESELNNILFRAASQAWKIFFKLFHY